MLPKWGVATHCSKANKEARLVERKFALVWRPVMDPVRRPIPPIDNPRKNFYSWRRWLRAETAQAAPTVILELVIGGLSGSIPCFKYS